MNKKIKNFINIVRHIKMTEEENKSVRARVMSFAKESKVEKFPLHFSVPSPYFSNFSFIMFSKIIGFALLFVVLGTSGLSYSSTRALPGDFLYPVKITKEKIEEKFASSPQQKIALKQKRIETRFKEVETLIKEKKITPENRSIAEMKIQEDKLEIGNDLEVINKENPQATIDAKTDLDASIQEHQDKIDILLEESAIGVVNTDDTLNETDFNGEENVDMGTLPTDTTPIVNPDINDPTTPTDSSTVPSTIDNSIIQDIKVIPETGTSPTVTTPVSAN